MSIATQRASGANSISLSQNYEQAATFLAAIGVQPGEPCNFRAINDKDKATPAIKRTGTLEQHWQELCQWNNKGYGVFVTVAQMDGQGDKLANVAGIRAHYIDCDTVDAIHNIQRAAGHSPAPWLTVQSSPGKGHVYWPISQRYRDNEYFDTLQRKLIQVYGSDHKIHDPTRVMRLPGFYHCKGNPHLVTWQALPGYGVATQPGALAASLAHVNVVQHGGGLRKPLGTPELAAPSLEWAVKALSRLDPNDMTRDDWISFTAAWKQAAWTVLGPETAFYLWSDWCARYRANDPGENLKQWNDIRETSAGWPAVEARAGLRAERVLGTPAPGQPHGGTSILTPLSALVTKPQAANWLIKGVLPARAAGVMFGQPGTGKSFIAIDMAAAVATGTPFNGYSVKKPGHVVYIAGEGHGGVTNRFIAKFRDIGNPPGAEKIHVSSKSVSLVSVSDEVTSLINEIDALPTPPALVVVDTLFRATAGADVNDSKEMSKFWKVIDLIKERYDCTVLIVHHSGRNETSRSFGSIVHLANADFEISIQSEEGGAVIECTKQKDAEEFKPMSFRLSAVEIGRDSDFEPIASCIVEFVARSAGDRAKDKETRKIGEEYETPSRVTSQKLGSMLVKIHDIVSQSEGISLTDTLLNTSIPKDMIDSLCQNNGIKSSDKRDGLEGLASPKGKTNPWIHMNEDRSLTITLRLARYARESNYYENFWDCLDLTPEQIAMCKPN